MTDLTVVGGIYVETCIQPLWNAVFGSAGRAATAIAPLIAGTTTLVGYVPDAIRQDVSSLAERAGFTLRAEAARAPVSFHYLHPLATPRISAVERGALPSIQVKAEAVLRYGMLEGDAVIDADIAVYDPQSSFGARSFGENGSRARRLAIVLNRGEARALTGQADPRAAARHLVELGDAEVAVVKMGSHGALVATARGETMIPAYRTSHVWKIGSGDVFSATFAAGWACDGVEPATAADNASRAAARYCETRSLPVQPAAILAALEMVPVRPGRGLVYLASPFFDIGQRWLVEECRGLLAGLGAEVFSPCHEVGPGPAAIVAPADIEGLERADAVFAILNGLDTGTVFEVGYAIKRGIPVVALAQNVKEEDLKMIAGSGCDVVDDLATALYRTVWALPPA